MGKSTKMDVTLVVPSFENFTFRLNYTPPQLKIDSPLIGDKAYTHLNLGRIEENNARSQHCMFVVNFILVTKVKVTP